MELAPITDIFVQEHLYRYGIEANKIRDWFLDLDKDFCTNINVKSPKDKRIPCKKPAPGCGIDDTCQINEICKSGFDGKYVCGGKDNILFYLLNNSSYSYCRTFSCCKE